MLSSVSGVVSAAGGGCALFCIEEIKVSSENSAAQRSCWKVLCPHGDDVPLNQWVTNQRAQYLYLKEGRVTSMTHNIMNMLDSIRFLWITTTKVGRGGSDGMERGERSNDEEMCSKIRSILIVDQGMGMGRVALHIVELR